MLPGACPQALGREHAPAPIAAAAARTGDPRKAPARRPPAQRPRATPRMSVEQAIRPILMALEARFAINRVSYQSIRQWEGEPGVL